MREGEKQKQRKMETRERKKRQKVRRKEEGRKEERKIEQRDRHCERESEKKTNQTSIIDYDRKMIKVQFMHLIHSTKRKYHHNIKKKRKFRL